MVKLLKVRRLNVWERDIGEVRACAPHENSPGRFLAPISCETRIIPRASKARGVAQKYVVDTPD